MAGEPVPYPYPAHPKRRSKWSLIIGLLLAAAVITASAVTIAYGVHTKKADNDTGGAFSDESATTAIQGYMDALERGDTEAIVRNALCGMYDAIRDKRSDQALAKLSSDALRKQFSEFRLISLDKVVYLSQYQAQALFTLRVTGATGGPAHKELQGLAQLLLQRGEILVCSYVLRTGGTF